jgi:protein-tyrosine phosphatase
VTGVEPRPLADLHCHILPGIDDGALDMADSVAMARQAAEDGIGAICATPHIRHDHDVRIGELADRVAEVEEAVSAERLPMRVVTGGEVAETALHGLTDDELRGVSLGATNTWILLEPAPGALGPSIVEAVEHLASGGRRAIIAHPERHLGPGAGRALAAAVSRGALVQATAAHLLDDAAPALLELAARGLVHLVASDAHSARAGRPVAIGAALARLEPRLSRFAAEAPAAILAGESVEPPQPAARARST